MKTLNKLDAPGAAYHRQQASLAYVNAFSASSDEGSWLMWIFAFGTAFAVVGLTTTTLARANRETLLRLLDRSSPPDARSDRDPVASSDTLPPSSPDPNAEVELEGPHSLVFRPPTPPSNTSTSDATAEADAETSEDDRPAQKHIDVDGTECVNRVDDRDVSDLTKAIAEDVPYLGDGHRGIPPQIEMTADEASAEHRRLLFTLWGIPPTGTGQFVSLPLYLPNGKYLGTRSLPAGVLQENLRQSLFLMMRGSRYELVYTRRAPTSRVVQSIDREGIHMARMLTPIRGVPLASIDRSTCRIVG